MECRRRISWRSFGLAVRAGETESRLFEALFLVVVVDLFFLLLVVVANLLFAFFRCRRAADFFLLAVEDAPSLRGLVSSLAIFYSTKLTSLLFMRLQAM